ncbi:FGGY family carbohydrate kinase [Neotabrizicola sp. VNH66]|uniref:FGGY family carbohydrate kinase n=1 Tax=Neotabrizicola sp. VNH66 TaxID=3400918 RepID=UPI003C0B31E8
MDEHIAVVDVGATNTRVVLLDRNLNEVANRKTETRHLPGPPYPQIDSGPLVDFIRSAIAELDRVQPVDTISVSAFGATAACLDERGALVLPVMDYLAPAPAAVDAGYARIAPPFGEVFSATSPGALTLAKQLYWLETVHPQEFARIACILPWSGYIAHRLGGAPATEVSNLGVFTHLLDVRSAEWSSLARTRGWDRLFAPRRAAWEVIGTMPGLRGRGEILAGIHDSNANWLRYMAGQGGRFTLVSTGTFVIGFDSGGDLDGLDPDCDAFSFNDIFGRPIACARFYGGYELGRLLDGVPATAASETGLAQVIGAGTFALPAFSDTGGPIAGRGKRGRILGAVDTPELRASLALLYYALMVDRMLEALRSTATVIIDGPAAQSPLVPGLIAALRPGQPVMTSAQSEGTVLGAGVLARMKGTGQLPQFPSALIPQAALNLPGLHAYRDRWLHLTQQDQTE